MSGRLLYDDHVHSRFSCDARDSLESLCDAAREQGLAGLTLTDHFDTEPSDPGYGWYDYDRTLLEVERIRQQTGPGFSLLLGAEICFQTPFAPRIADFIRSCPLDFALGAVHYARHEFIDPAYFRRHDVHSAYEAYLEAVEELVQSGLFDSLAHLDMPKLHSTPVYGRFAPEHFWEQIERILQLLIRKGMALELNTKGWRQLPGESYPGEAILRRYVELGGTRITIGSDTHDAAHLGYGIERAHVLARRLGLTHLTRYVQRRPQLVPLAEGLDAGAASIQV
ncbi:MAG: histidinol-phosphatase HisJ family protein [Anaerolineae bacterium]|nr:histidinol-phosphatase HisJ family protein [Anaerolineae bacterium]